MMMTGVNQLFVDTNIIVYAADALSPFNQAASAVLLSVRQQGVELIISQQILREYLVVNTRSFIITGIPTMADIIQNLQALQNDFKVVQDSSQVLDNLISLLQTVPIGGKQIHDANIVATMQAYGISHLLTHNVRDFARFAHLITVVPLQATTP
jgi:predicted nucleic acid-binding protein